MGNLNPLSLVDGTWEMIDPTPDVFALFIQFDKRFFFGKLACVAVSWSKRMTTCAGICSYQPKGGFCSIRLSEPLLKLRPRKDLVETLLHEMIHAFLFVTSNKRDRDDHGPEFRKHMNRINIEAGTSITVYHNFHDEVSLYKTHWWKCNGICQHKPPYFGIVKRATNRAPSSNDFWFADHLAMCGGTFVKIKEPDGYKSKKKISQTNGHSERQGRNKMDNYLFPRNGNSTISNSNNKPNGNRNRILDDNTPIRKLPKAFPFNGNISEFLLNTGSQNLLKMDNQCGKNEVKTPMRSGENDGLRTNYDSKTMVLPLAKKINSGLMGKNATASFFEPFSGVGQSLSQFANANSFSKITNGTSLDHPSNTRSNVAAGPSPWNHSNPDRGNSANRNYFSHFRVTNLNDGVVDNSETDLFTSNTPNSNAGTGHPRDFTESVDGAYDHLPKCGSNGVAAHSLSSNSPKRDNVRALPGNQRSEHLLHLALQSRNATKRKVSETEVVTTDNDLSIMVECPVCGRSMPQESLYDHLDECDGQDEDDPAGGPHSLNATKRKRSDSPLVDDRNATIKISKPQTRANECPICGRSIPEDIVYEHVDECIRRDDFNITDTRDMSDGSVVCCPVCNARMNENEINAHLDTCLL